MTVIRAFASMLGYEGREEMLDLDIGRELFLSPEQRATYSEEMARHDFLRNYEVALAARMGGLLP